MIEYINAEMYSGFMANVIREYSHPHRAYHNFSHITNMLMNYDKFPVEHDRLAFLAILFHDVVYRTDRTDNEERSADYAEECMRSIDMTDDEIDTVRRYIMATKTHEVTDDLMTNVIIDLDLYGLSASWDEYRRAGEAIRHEYFNLRSAVGGYEEMWQLFLASRAMFLRGMLRRTGMFVSGTGLSHLDMDAHRNMRRELDIITKYCRNARQYITEEMATTENNDV